MESVEKSFEDILGYKLSDLDMDLSLQEHGLSSSKRARKECCFNLIKKYRCTKAGVRGCRKKRRTFN